MMKTLRPGFERQARVWIGELPDAIYPAEKSVRHVLSTSDRSVVEPLLAAVEFFAHVGPRTYFGLLGGQLLPSETGRLAVNVSITDTEGKPFLNNPSSKVDKIRVGLPSEYVGGVLAGVALAKKELDVLSSGNLLINCAAHGYIGSSESTFKHLALILLKLFNSQNILAMDEEQLAKFFASIGYSSPH
jgi:hypothetical protein